MQCLQKEAVEYKGDKSFRYIGILEAERKWIKRDYGHTSSQKQYALIR